MNGGGKGVAIVALHGDARVGSVAYLTIRVFVVAVESDFTKKVD